MNLKALDDSTLLINTQKLIQRERELLIEILHHLREIERRRLFCGCCSLFDYAVKKLGYSEDQAQRRIEAMRALKDIPELEDKISLGSVTLTHVGIAQKLFRQEKKSVGREFSAQEKLEVIEQLEHKSTREAERVVAQLSSDPVKLKRDQVRVVTEELVEVKFLAARELVDKLEKLKGLLAHKKPNISMGDLVNQLCDLGITEWDLGAQAVSAQAMIAQDVSKSGTARPAAPRKQRGLAVKHRRAIPKSEQREVWRRAQSLCEICGSKFALQIDHLKPKALGGSDELNNLRLLCRHCNQREAIVHYGQDKMEVYINKLRQPQL